MKLFEFFEFLVGIITVGGVFYVWYRAALSDWKEKLGDPGEWQELIGSGDHPWANAYLKKVSWLLGWSDSFFGAAKLGFQAFERCFGLVFCYPFMAVAMAWALTNQHSIGHTPLFENETDFWLRMYLVLLLFLSIIWLTFLTCNVDKVAQKIQLYIERYIDFSDAVSERSARHLAFAYILIILLCAFGGSVLMTVAVASISFGLLAGVAVCVVAITLSCEHSGIRVFFMALCITAMVIFCLIVDYSGMASRSMTDLAAIFAFLFLILPLANAVADYLSIAASRSFLEWVDHHRPSPPKIFGVLLLDLLFGFFCLVGLLLALALSMEAWSTVSPETVPLNWRDYWSNFRADWKNGIALGLMLLTTILPTILHLGLGIGAVLSYGLRFRRHAIRQLEECLLEGGASDVNRTKIAKRLLRADICGALLGLTVVLLLAAALTALLWTMAPPSELPMISLQSAKS